MACPKFVRSGPAQSAIGIGTEREQTPYLAAKPKVGSKARLNTEGNPGNSLGKTNGGGNGRGNKRGYGKETGRRWGRKRDKADGKTRGIVGKSRGGGGNKM